MKARGVLCVGEFRGGKPTPATFELLSAGLGLAGAKGEPLTLLLIGGPGTAQAAQALASHGADRILVIEGPAFSAFLDDAYEAALKPVLLEQGPRALLLPGSVFGRSLAPRLAVALNAGLASDAVGLAWDPEGRLVVLRSAYAGSVVAEILLKRFPAMATVRPLAFKRAEECGKKAEIVVLPVSQAASKMTFKGFAAGEAGEIDLGAADKIVSGGRGLGTPEGFKVSRELASALGAAVGASRAAVDAGWIPYKHQVGLTGRSVRPKLYVACGISGQIQHLAGMKSGDVIVAINTDPECPMMKLATLAVQGDLYQVIPALIAEIRRLRGA